jgi:hypothetical protein
MLRNIAHREISFASQFAPVGPRKSVAQPSDPEKFSAVKKFLF